MVCIIRTENHHEIKGLTEKLYAYADENLTKALITYRVLTSKHVKLITQLNGVMKPPKTRY